MNDLELLDKYCEESLAFVSPLLLREVMGRGLYHIINFLPGNEKEAKAVVRARLAKIGKTFGDDQIDQLASNIYRIEFLRAQLVDMNMADSHKVIPVLKEMQDLSETNLSILK